MADFNKAWAAVSKIEAGYVNLSTDSGGETYRGISIVNNPDWPGWPIVHKTISDLGIKDTLNAGQSVFTRIDATLRANTGLAAMVDACYKRKYWDPMGLDHEPDEAVAVKVLDIAINQGLSQAKKGYEDAKDA